MLTWQFWHCRQDIEAIQPWCKLKDMKEIDAHLMQFTVWRYSAKSRMFIDWLVTIGFAVYIHILVFRITD